MGRRIVHYLQTTGIQIKSKFDYSTLSSRNKADVKLYDMQRPSPDTDEIIQTLFHWKRRRKRCKDFYYDETEAIKLGDSEPKSAHFLMVSRW